jgi:hypothetical protein
MPGRGLTSPIDHPSCPGGSWWRCRQKRLCRECRPTTHYFTNQKKLPGSRFFAACVLLRVWCAGRAMLMHASTDGVSARYRVPDWRRDSILLVRYSGPSSCQFRSTNVSRRLVRARALHDITRTITELIGETGRRPDAICTFLFSFRQLLVLPE